MTTSGIHGNSVTETLEAISQEFVRLRWLAFLNSNLSHAVSAELRYAGFISVGVMSELVNYSKANETMSESTASAWFDGIESIQLTLHRMEKEQLAAISKFVNLGIVTAFFVGVGVLLATLGMVVVGLPGWLSIITFLIAASFYTTISILIEKKIRIWREKLTKRIGSTCRKFPESLWNDIHRGNSTKADLTSSPP